MVIGTTTLDDASSARLTMVRSMLDSALLGLREIEDADLDVPSVERALGTALRHVYAAAAAVDYPSFCEASEQGVESVRSGLIGLMEVPSEDAHASSVAAMVAQSLGMLQQVRWQLIDAELPRNDGDEGYVFASVELPQLLTLRRDAVRPAIPLDERTASRFPSDPPVVVPAPMTLEQLLGAAAAHRDDLQKMADEPAEDEGESPPAPALPSSEELDEDEALRFGLPITDDQLVRLRARDFCDDLGIMGRQRRCTAPEPWASGRRAERRMLVKVDAIVACGVDAFEELVRRLDDAPIPDPETTYANLYFFGSIAGDDTFDQILRLIEITDLSDDDMREMVTDALVLAPHGRTDRHFSSWLDHPDDDRRLLSVEILRRRRVLSVEQFDAMGNDPDPRVLASLARSVPTLPQFVPGALGWFLNQKDPRIVGAALESTTRMCNPLAYERAVALVERHGGAYADAAMYVAITGGPEAAEVLRADLAVNALPITLRACGWFGDATFVPFLLGRLREGDEAQSFAALDALERLTGASIVDAGIVAEYRETEEPFVRHERREYMPPGILDGDADAWTAWWDAWGGRAEEGVRYRWGQRYVLGDNLHELRDFAFIQRDRPWAALEAEYRGRLPPLLDWTDLIVRQQRAVDEWTAMLGGRAERGGWARPHDR